jgi:alpha-beta hydrolase superfamily lysophospholipase
MTCGASRPNPSIIHRYLSDLSERKGLMAVQRNETTLTGAQQMQIYVQSWVPDAPVRGMVALVHGFGEHSSRYNYLADALTGHGYAVFALDHRGHGRSPGRRGHVERWDDYLGDVGALLQMARLAEPALPLFLFGHSLGGLIVLSYAIQHGEGLSGVIASAPLLAPAKVSPVLVYAARILSSIKPDFGMDTGVDASTISRDPAEVQRYANDPLVHSQATARFGTEVEKAQAWTQAHAGELRVPVLIYHGDADPLVPIAGSRTFFANLTVADKQLIEWPGGYHESHNDLDRKAVFVALLAWLDAHCA